jgi:N-acetylmuramoyl-L-alanine amidase
MKHSCLFILLAALILVGAAPTDAAARAAQVEISGSRYDIGSVERHDFTYVSLSGIVDLLGGRLNWSVVGHQVTYAVDTNRFEFLIDAPFFKLNDSIRNMTHPALLIDGQLYVAAETFLPYFNQVMPHRVTWNRDTKLVRLDTHHYNVTDISFVRKTNGLLIELFLTRSMAYDIFVTEGNWLNISIRDADIDASRILSRRNSRLMYDLKVHQSEASGQVSVRLKRALRNWHHKLTLNPPRIQISIADQDFTLEETPAPNVPATSDNKIDVIVIDPGHGGRDYGAIGPGKTREKDIVLAIGKELAKLIRKDKEFKVIMTRDRDVYVNLDERARIANENGADLFISLHLNASPKRTPRGWNVFYLAPARNDSARAVAQFENSFFLRELSSGEFPEEARDTDDPFGDPILGILNEMLLTEFLAESHDFALMVDREFRRHLKIPARGVDMAGFFVLNKIYSPSVLVEAGFISNAAEEKILRDSDYQKAVAQAIYNAIKRFKAKYEQ